jgi:hypothetical protein
VGGYGIGEFTALAPARAVIFLRVPVGAGSLSLGEARAGGLEINGGLMLTREAFWLVEEPALDEPADLLTIPEIRQHVAHEPHDDELGLRALLVGPASQRRPSLRFQ